jgi:hypothetical protein
MRIIWLIVLILCGVLLAKVSMTNSNQICFESEAGDTGSFGSYIAINDKYLAVGDPFANRVCIYTRNNSDQWTRTKYILPPINSVPYRVGQGFGNNLRIDNDALLISDEVILIVPETEQYTKGIVDSEEFQFVESVPVYASIYLAKLSSEAEPERLKLFPNTTPPGFSKFTMLSEGKVKQIAVPKSGEEQFGYSAALHKNLFLVGSPCFETGGGAWLFELDKPEKKPLKLALPKTYLGTTVAISEQFAAVGNQGRFAGLTEDSDLPRKILIRAIDSGATSVLDEVGIISLSENILAVMRPELPDEEPPALLKVFYLDKNATPNLIFRREKLKNALVQNGFLVTVEGTYSSGIRLCIESMHQ